MPSVQLDDEEWQRVLAIIATAPWNVANNLLMKIGEQLRHQQDGPRGLSTQEGNVIKQREVPVKSAQLESDKATH
jgi:hypothetical protein